MVSTQDAQELLPDVCGRKRLQALHKPGKGVRFIMVTLPFHALSAGFALIMSVFGGGIFVPGKVLSSYECVANYLMAHVLSSTRFCAPCCSPRGDMRHS